ncbi:LysR substrate-binding domain-containing protein [Arhodomonas aquaeolei]|uniref:LysR substrate-binding domain-containing protein n=1 Tax=Arhodomonas aquaeolei TaxID=2369 RepID=UPI000372B4CB|nr:LysR substrate-binding domain-containing protein [Arhodomonas aquaeolei]
MQLRSLRLFVAVARTGSFVAAAASAHTVQSNVTAHVKKLEGELGRRLLTRAGGAGLTPAGRSLLGYAERLLALHDGAVAEVRGEGEPAGTLRIGAMETTAAVRLPPLLAAFHEHYPAVTLELITGTTAELFAGLADGALDGAFVAGEVPLSGYRVSEVFHERLVLAAALTQTHLPDPGRLASSAFMAFRQGCSYRQRIELFLAGEGVPAARIFEFGTVDAMLGCVAAGMGFAMLPATVVAARGAGYGVHGLTLPEDVASVVTRFVAPPEAASSAALTAFMAMLPAPPDSNAAAAAPTMRA